MKLLKDFKAYNEYVGLPKPLDNNIDIGYYPADVLLKSKPVLVDFYRISIKSNYIDKNSPNYPEPITAAFFSSPDRTLEWDIDHRFDGIYLNISKALIDENRFLFRNYLDYGIHEALFLTDKEEKEIRLVFDLMIEHYSNEKINYELLISYAHVLVSLIESFYKRQFSTQTKKYNRIVSDFQQYLHDYYAQPVNELPSVQYFADKLHINPNYLGDIIKHYTNKSASETIQDFIHKKAIELLETRPNLNNAEIAYELGFEYPNYFAKFFKKHSNQTPSEYKKKRVIGKISI
jgi:YesN/AraC family two-component response regulator